MTSSLFFWELLQTSTLQKTFHTLPPVKTVTQHARTASMLLFPAA